MEKKEKKELIRNQARKMRLLQHHAQLHQTARDDFYEDQTALLEAQHDAAIAQEAKGEEPTWSARTQQIRNRLTGQKRSSLDKWNRFAGTESAGAMGR